MGRNRRRKKKKRYGLWVGISLLSGVLILIGVGAAALYAKLDKIDFQPSENMEVSINPEVKLEGYTNLALFGVDSRESDLEHSNSDAIIIISIAHDEKKIKMVSVYRDTFLDVGDNDYRKCNAAYMQGGPEQAISMLNRNLDLNISDYIAVDFNIVAEMVDLVDGITLTLTEEEVGYVNDYCVETSEVTGKTYEPILPETEGEFHLNGVQAVSYARIRYTAGNDFKRTERQRQVIQLVSEKIKNSSPTELYKMADKILPMIKTSFDKKELLSMGVAMMTYSIDESTGFPFELEGKDIPEIGSCVVATSLSSNVKELHELLFQNQNYQVSAQVDEISYGIDKLLSGGL